MNTAFGSENALESFRHNTVVTEPFFYFTVQDATIRDNQIEHLRTADESADRSADGSAVTMEPRGQGGRCT